MPIQEIKFEKFTWYNISSPKEPELELLSNKFKFHHLALDDCRSNIQQPKIDDYDDYLFMVFHLPRYIKKIKRTIALELDVFLSKKFLITIHNGDLKPLNSLFDRNKKEAENIIANPSFLLYEILKESFNYCFPMLEKIGEKLDRIEDELYVDQSQKTLEEISIIAQDIINFRRIIRPQRYFIEDLEQLKTKFIKENLEIYFNDISDKIDRIWDNLNSFKDVCDVLQRTNESILTQRLNSIMKILTVISVIMLPLTVLTGFYGMNVVGLPLASHRYAAEIVIILLVIISGGMLAYFRKNHWL